MNLKPYEKIPLIAMSVLGMSDLIEIWEKNGSYVIGGDTDFAGRGSTDDSAVTASYSIPLMLAREYAGGLVRKFRKS